MIHINKVFYLLLLLAVVSCDRSRNLEIDTSDINVNIEIRRYGEALFSRDPDRLDIEQIQEWHKDYPFFVDAGVDSSDLRALVDYLQDPVNKDLYKSVADTYDTIQDLEAELSDYFRHLKYYFPNYQVPTVYTYISSLNIEQPVLYVDTVLAVGLDMYLGRGTKYYDMAGIPKYMSKWFVSERIVPDVCDAMLSEQIVKHKDPSLLDYMVESGKLYFLMDALMPWKEDNVKIRYTKEQLSWIEEHEIFVWGLILEEELLFSRERSKIKSFIDEGPFTSTISKKAPPRIAHWLGWQMVRAYMDKNQEVHISKLLNETDSRKILKQSGYKPAQKATR